jgi:hypothetical protein
MSENTTEINWPQVYTDKANEIKNLLIGFSQQDIENVLTLVKDMLPSKLFLVASQE